MNRRSILTKTGKGLMEATGKTSNLSRDLRNILKEIDGKVSVSELLDKFDRLNEQKLLELLSGMERDGYVREFIGKQDEGPRTPVGRVPGPPSLGEGSDLDFTAFTPAKPNAKANEEARLQAQAQEIARQAQATRAREEAAAKARAKAEGDLKARQHAAGTKTGANAPLPPLINPSAGPSIPPVAGILGAGPEAQARAQADAQARAQGEALERARREAEEKARRDAEEKARREAEARARAEIEAAVKREAEERALREIRERTRREEEEKARREAEVRARLEAEQRVKREAEERARRELEERTRREVAERLRREEEERRRREEEERARREAERQARIEAETKARVDAELRAKREAEERARRDDDDRRQAEKRKRAEEEQRKREEEGQAEALERALREEQENARREAEERAERGEQERAEQDERARQEQEESEQQRDEEERQARDEERRARREEQAAARAAAKQRKAERARERAGEEAWRGDEDALRDSGGAALSAAQVWDKRKPRSFLKSLAAMLVVLVVLGVAVLPFVPLETVRYEKSAQRWLGLPVKIGSVYLALLPLPQLKFERVAVGTDPQLRAAVVRATPELGTLLEERTILRSLALENVTVPKEFLAALLQDKGGGKGLGVQRITAKDLKIDAPELALPGLELEASLSPDGALKSATFSNGGQLSVKLEPRGGRAAIEISAATLPIPVGIDFGLSDFSGKGTVTASELVLTSTEARAFGGRIFGSVRLRWSSGWSLDGDLSARQMEAAKVAGPLLGTGTLQGRGRLAMRGLLPERMILNSQLDGSFSVQKGSVSNVDMTRLLQGSGSGGGTTMFTEMSGDFSADPNRLLVRNIRLAAGLLSGLGQLEMDPQRNLSGRMHIELRAQSVQARSTVSVAGTLMSPQFRRSN
ncbi:MAG TPA: hypothetical protein VJO54_16715 [Burkholderiales bacterium]|nr:hypothetical protein [Burkholderiales bacterium]